MKTFGFVAPFFVAALAAQQSDQPVIRTTTRLVQVDVIVRAGNAPVRDLRAEDFTLFEKGKKRKIAVFARNVGAADVSASLGDQARSAVVEPGLVTNRPAAGASPKNVTIVLLDGVNTEIRDQASARSQLLKFLRQIKPEDRVAVYALGTKLRVLNDFTGDPGRLTATVARFSGDNLGFAAEAAPVDTPDGIGSDKAIEDAIRNQANDMVSDYTVQIRAEKTVAALEAIARHVAGIPGRKNLIWITSGFPFTIGTIGDGQANSEDSAFDSDISGKTAAKKGPGASGSTALYGANDRDGNPARNQKNFGAEALRATRALNDANVAVYPVDARGLTVMPKSMTAEQNFGVSHSSAMRPSGTASTIPTGVTAMQNVAVSTGGVAFYNGNDLGKAIRTAADDGEATYTLGFYAEASELDSKFHDIRVQVDRKGLEVRYRRGYVAVAPASAAGLAKERADAAREALWGPLEAAGIGLKAGSEKGDKAGSLRVVVAIEPRDISMEQKDGKWTAALDLFFGQRAADGKELGVTNTPLGLSLDASKRDAVMAQGLSITKVVDLAPGVAEVRILVSDRATGRLGSLVLPVKQ